MFLIFVTSPFVAFGDVVNVGIIKGIWFSQSEFFAGDTIRVYTGLQNNTGFDVDGTIEFFDNDVSIGTKKFSALDNRIIESWIDVVVEEGKHEFTVVITEARKNKIGEDITPITPQVLSSESIAVVEVDTDGDNIPDSDDDDDDNDGVSDREERKEGTDPLDKNDMPVEIQDLNPDPVVILDNTTLIEQSPEFIEELVGQNDFLKKIILSLGALQQNTHNFIDTQQDYVTQEISYAKDLSTQGNVVDDASAEQANNQSVTDETGTRGGINESNTKRTWLWYVYQGILKIFSWIFSLWFFWLLLPFLIIYILMKILFWFFRKYKYN